MFIPREIQKAFQKVEKAYPVIAVTGARQAGKTTFLKEQGSQQQARYLLFDDPDVRDLFNTDIKRFEQQYLEGANVSILDEVQNGKDAGSKLKYLAEKGKKLWITSSSEVLLGKEVLSHLVGRVSIVRLYPFSLPEFLQAKGQKAWTEKALSRHMISHMLYGGYPKVVLSDDLELKKTMLRDLYETMILKDVVRTFSLGNAQSLEQFVRYLSINTGGIVQYNTISSSLTIAFRTTKNYLDALEKSYLLIRISPFYTNKNKELSKQPKVYFLDTGLRNSIAKEFPTEPTGKLFENYVFSELLKLGFFPKYWRAKSKAEVDFIIEKDNEVIPIEVKLRADPRHVERSLQSFIEAYHPKRALIITFYGSDGKKQIEGCSVITTSLMKARQILTT